MPKGRRFPSFTAGIPRQWHRSRSIGITIAWRFETCEGGMTKFLEIVRLSPRIQSSALTGHRPQGADRRRHQHKANQTLLLMIRSGLGCKGRKGRMGWIKRAGLGRTRRGRLGTGRKEAERREMIKERRKGKGHA